MEPPKKGPLSSLPPFPRAVDPTAGSTWEKGGVPFSKPSESIKGSPPLSPSGAPGGKRAGEIGGVFATPGGKGAVGKGGVFVASGGKMVVEIGGLLFIILMIMACQNRGPLTVEIFWDPTCDECRDLRERIVPALQAKYGLRVAWTIHDLNAPGTYAAFSEREKALGKTGTPFPAMIVGKTILGGTKELSALPDVLAKELGS